jgi:Mg2+/Co2+ transporter CorC
MNWLLERIQSKTHDENRSYAAELLSILLQDSIPNRQELGKKDGVEAILKVLSVSDSRIEDMCESHWVTSNFGIASP